jgi:hypothetical protein
MTMHCLAINPYIMRWLRCSRSDLGQLQTVRDLLKSRHTKQETYEITIA